MQIFLENIDILLQIQQWRRIQRCVCGRQKAWPWCAETGQIFRVTSKRVCWAVAG